MSKIKVGDKVRVVKEGIHYFKLGTEGVIEVLDGRDETAYVRATFGDILPEQLDGVNKSPRASIAQWCTIDSLEVIE